MYTFNQKAYQRVIDFFYLCCPDRELLEWQDNLIREGFGYLDDDGMRRTKRIWLEVARGNGKSTFQAIIALYMVCYDGETQADVAIAASSREQAGHVFRECADIVRNCNKLKAALHITPSKKEIYYPKKNAMLRVLSSDSKGGHGHNLHMACIDEVHTLDSASEREFLNALERGCGKFHKNSLILYTTTAGYNKISPAYDYHVYGQKIIAGEVKDDSFLSLIYQADEALPPDSVENWRKANPALGKLITEKQLRQDYEFSKTSQASMATFSRQRLNLWTSACTAFIDLTSFDRCYGNYPSDLSGEITLGVDLSGGGSDLTALAGLVEYKGKFYTICHAWTTSEALANRDKTNAQSYQPFIDAGQLEVVPGNVIDFSLLRKHIDYIAQRFRVKAIVFDKYGSNETTQILMNQGYTVYTMPQTHSAFSEPMRKFEKLILEQRLCHDGNGILRFCVANLEAKEDNNHLIKPVKSTQSAKIDMATALIQALYSLPIDPTSYEPRKSVYDTRGLVTI